MLSLLAGGAFVVPVEPAHARTTAATARFVDALQSVQEADSLWTVLGETMARLRRMEGDLPAMSAPSAAACERLSAAEADADLFSARSEARARDYGLGVEAGVRGDFADDQVDEGVPGAYVGVSWEVLQAGLFENRRLSDLFRIRSEAAAVQARQDGVREANRCATIAGSLAFAPLLQRLLDEKLATVNALTAARREAYLSGFGDLEEVLEAEREIERTRSELRALDALSLIDAGPLARIDWFPPAVDLDLDALRQRQLGGDLDFDLLQLQEEEVRLMRQVDSRTRLRFYLRYGYRPRSGQPDRQGMTGGLIFRMPLSQATDAGLDAELEAVRRRSAIGREVRTDVTLAAYYAFRDQLSTVIRGHYAYLENYERVRRASARWTVDPESADLSGAMNDIIGLHNAALDRALALRELYKAASEVFVAARQPFDPTILVPVDLPDTGYRGRVGDRSLYVWSEAFNQYANDYLVELARAKGFSRVVLSAGRAVREDKLDRFRAAAVDADLAIELTLSTNVWLQPELRDGVTARVSGLVLSGADLHLDVEPQMLESFRENPDSLLEAYIDVITLARAALTNEARLSVSVPIWWPAEIYARIDAIADRVFLMAYEMTDAETVARRVRPMLDSIDADKLVLALRAEDFATEWDMDLVFAHVAGTTGITQGAVHDLAGFLALLGNR
jgi:hypothetical protein